jgi:hypothetical protein
MAYAGYLLKIGNFTIPTSIIKADSYYAYVNMQDYEPWTDAKGYLHRDVVDLKALKVEFETKAMLTNTEFASLMSSIKAQFTKATARECNITAYIPELDDYVTQKGYMADFKPQIYFADANKIQYDPVRFAFIGGVSSATD